MEVSGQLNVPAALSLDRRLSVPQSLSGRSREEKIPDPLVFQPVASRYTGSELISIPLESTNASTSPYVSRARCVTTRRPVGWPSGLVKHASKVGR
jgi:hypothetical protein